MTNKEKAEWIANSYDGDRISIEDIVTACMGMANWKDEQLSEIMLKYTLWMNKRGFFAEDLCVDFEHQIKTFLEQIYP